MTPNKENKMELNRLSVSVISVLITVALCLSAFSYRTGSLNNELVNIKYFMEKNETDLKQDIKDVEERKADKNVVDIFLEQVKDINRKIDKLINRS